MSEGVGEASTSYKAADVHDSVLPHVSILKHQSYLSLNIIFASETLFCSRLPDAGGPVGVRPALAPPRGGARTPPGGSRGTPPGGSS